jgi:hypothetical protein
LTFFQVWSCSGCGGFLSVACAVATTEVAIMMANASKSFLQRNTPLSMAAWMK